MKIVAALSFPRSGIMEVNGAKIHYNFTILNEVGSSLALRITGWIFDPENPGREIMLKIEHGDISRKYTPTLRRNDVYSHFHLHRDNFGSAAPCGYDILIPLSTADETNKVSIVTKDGSNYLGEIHRYEKKLIVGKGNWLFLDGDSNESVKQFTGGISPTAEWRSKWREYFDYISINIAKVYPTAFVVSPSKEEIFPDYYPERRSESILIDDLYKEHRDIAFNIDLRPALSLYRELCYDKGDTHWSEFGGNICVREAMKRFGIKIPLEDRFLVIRQGGDLYDKGAFDFLNYRICSTFAARNYRIKNNGVIHHGNIQEYLNEGAPVHKSVMLLGGSSGEQMMPALVQMFKNVHYVYTAASVDMNYIRSIGPDYVILQINQRFIIKPPETDISIEDIAGEKIRTNKIDPSAIFP